MARAKAQQQAEEAEETEAAAAMAAASCRRRPIDEQAEKQCAKRHQSSCLYIGGKWLLFLYTGSSSVDVPVHSRTSEVGGVQGHTRTSEVGGVQDHTTEKCGLVLEYRNTPKN